MMLTRYFNSIMSYLTFKWSIATANWLLQVQLLSLVCLRSMLIKLMIKGVYTNQESGRKHHQKSGIRKEGI